jgi:hypothetical protein
MVNLKNLRCNQNYTNFNFILINFKWKADILLIRCHF